MSPAYFFSFKYSKSHKTGSGHAADSKLRYTIQFSILMLCAKYQEAGLCGSREKIDRNYLVSIAYVHNIQSRIKQEVDMSQIQKCVTRYCSPYWCWRRRKTTDSDPYIALLLKWAGDTIIQVIWWQIYITNVYQIHQRVNTVSIDSI